MYHIPVSDPTCTHSSTLLYFDTVNGVAHSWEVCELCQEILHESLHPSPEDIADQERHQRWLKTHRCILDANVYN